jgi:DNA-binding MarR family transcriptional regulator
VAAQIRRFNRLYIDLIGALDDRHEGLDLTLAESRCLFTIDRLGNPDVGLIAQTLRLDLGYASRLVSRLERAGRVRRTRASDDHRRKVVTLTDAGAVLLAEVARRSDSRMDAITAHLTRHEVARLLRAMHTIHDLLEPGRPDDDRRLSASDQRPATV